MLVQKDARKVAHLRFQSMSISYTSSQCVKDKLLLLLLHKPAGQVAVA